MNTPKLRFDRFGLLQPDTAHAVTKAELVELCVSNHEGNAAQVRTDLIKELDQYNKSVLQITGCDAYEQWVDGSFATKKAVPNDIDVVSFLDYRIVDKCGDALLPYRRGHVTLGGKVDCYIVTVYPRGHEYFVRTDGDRKQWLHFFTRTRATKRRAPRPKGFFVTTVNASHHE